MLSNVCKCFQVFRNSRSSTAKVNTRLNLCRIAPADEVEKGQATRTLPTEGPAAQTPKHPNSLEKLTTKIVMTLIREFISVFGHQSFGKRGVHLTWVLGRRFCVLTSNQLGVPSTCHATQPIRGRTSTSVKPAVIGHAIKEKPRPLLILPTKQALVGNDLLQMKRV